MAAKDKREQMKRDSKAQLIHEWDQGEHRYRLLAVGKWQAGYDDRFVIERLGADALGEPQWTTVHAWEADSFDEPTASMSSLLIGALRSTLRQAS